jgi:hypothetical protein
MFRGVRLSDVGNWAVVAFGMILCIACIFSVSCLGIRVMFPRRYQSARHKRRKHQERGA